MSNSKNLAEFGRPGPLVNKTITENVVVLTASATASPSRVYVLTAALTLTLPAAPTPGDWVVAQNSSGASTCAIARNGSNIMSLAEDLIIDSNFAAVKLVYADAIRGWVFGV